MPYYEKETGPNGEERYVQKSTAGEMRAVWLFMAVAAIVLLCILYMASQT